MTNSQLHESILNNLFKALEKQSEAYLTLMSNQEYTHEQRKDFENEVSQINKVLQEINSNSINYTVSELETLKNTFNDKLIQLSQVITDLEINTLKIEFDSLTPQQKEFLKGAKGDKGDKGDKGENGLNGTFEALTVEQKASLKGEKGDKGDKGEDGINGINGTNGVNGNDGLSAYQIALNNGFVGTELQFLDSLKGQDGLDGTNGLDGVDGLSAYQIALKNGFVGTELQFLDSLKGQKGNDGLISFEALTAEQKASLKGEKGEKGDVGEKGDKGEKGDNGLDGVISFEALTAEQKASLKGEKGDKGDKGEKGDNGLNGTFEALTQEQKQQIANLIPVTGLSNFINYTVQKHNNTMPYLTFKTNVKFEQDFIFTLDIKYDKDKYLTKKIGQFYQARGSYRKELFSSVNIGTSVFEIFSTYDTQGNLSITVSNFSGLSFFNLTAFVDSSIDKTVTHFFNNAVPTTTLDFNAYYSLKGL